MRLLQEGVSQPLSRGLGTLTSHLVSLQTSHLLPPAAPCLHGIRKPKLAARSSSKRSKVEALLGRYKSANTAQRCACAHRRL